MFEIFIMNLNDELINNILIDSDYEFPDEIDDSDLDPDFTIGNNDRDSDITHISGNIVIIICILCTYNINLF
jgi:hypothetical protein